MMRRLGIVGSRLSQIGRLYGETRCRPGGRRCRPSENRLFRRGSVNTGAGQNHFTEWLIDNSEWLTHEPE